MNRVAPWLIAAVFLSIGLVSCCVCHGQALDFKVEGPTEVVEGEYVELTVKYPEGVKADVDFVPVEETNFGVHPIVTETVVKGKLVPEIVGKTCTFSARCQGEREIVVVATAFASFDGVPRLKSLKHRIAVKANKAPNPPPEPPPAPEPPKPDPPKPTPPKDDSPTIPLPGATSGTPEKSDVEKITLILDNVLDRLEAIEKRATQVSVAAPAPVSGTSKPAAVPAPVAVVKASPAIVDVKPGHWSVASARNEWSPSKAETIAHLRQTHPSKAAQHEPLENLSHEELRTLHDDAHEGRSSARTTTYVSAPAMSACPGGVCPTSSSSAVRYAQPASGCPGGVCPTYRSTSSSYGRGFFRWGR